MATKYWVVKKSDGELLSESAIEALQAADTMLTHDGHLYEIRKDDEDGMFYLWVSQFSANASSGKGNMTRWAEYRGETQDAVIAEIIERGGVLGSTAEPTEYALTDMFALGISGEVVLGLGHTPDEAREDAEHNSCAEIIERRGADVKVYIVSDLAIKSLLERDGDRPEFLEVEFEKQA